MTATPFFLMLRTMLTTSSFAPTSIPRVGSLRINTLGRCVSQRASATFCWFPPERPPAIQSGRGGRTPNSAIRSEATLRSRAGRRKIVASLSRMLMEMFL
jgi:hypothetical protein